MFEGPLNKRSFKRVLEKFEGPLNEGRVNGF